MKIFKGQYIAVGLLIVGVLLAFWYLGLGGYLAGDFWTPDKTKAAEINPFVTGLVVPFLTLGSALLVYENLRNTSRQNFSTNFFKLIEMHNKLRDAMSDDINEISIRGEGPSKG